MQNFTTINFSFVFEIEKKLVVCVQNGKFLLTEKGKLFDIIGASKASTAEQGFKTPVKLRLPNKKQSSKKKRKMNLRQTNWNRKHEVQQFFLFLIVMGPGGTIFCNLGK